MRPLFPLTAALLALALLSPNVHAGGDAGRGKQKSATCAGCHGAEGNSVTPDFPRLAGQHEDYLMHTLAAYKSGKRKNAIMAGMVAGLNEQDLEDLAAYFAAQKGLTLKY